MNRVNITKTVTKTVTSVVASSSEIATILFALRFLQANYKDSGIENAEHFKEDYNACTENEIDDLCILINTSTVIL